MRQNAWKLIGKNQSAANGGRGVRDGLGQKHALHAPEVRQQQGQRHQQEHLAQQGNEHRDAGGAQRHKRILAGTLQPENAHARQEERHHPFHRGNQAPVVRKGRGHQVREAQHQHNQYEIERKHRQEHDAEARFQPFAVAVPVVVAGHRHEALGKSRERYADKQHGALHDGQCTDVDVAVRLQTAVQHKTNQTFRAGHDKGRHAQGQNGAHNRAVPAHVARLKAQGSPA